MATNEVLLKDVKPLLRGFECQVIVLQRGKGLFLLLRVNMLTLLQLKPIHTLLDMEKPFTSTLLQTRLVLLY